jgi:hypothetical protein
VDWHARLVSLTAEIYRLDKIARLGAGAWHLIGLADEALAAEAEQAAGGMGDTGD